MQELTFLQDMALVMVTSAVTMVICHRLRLPVVLGYILAGLLIGPHTPPYPLVSDLHSIHTLSALGIIFLLFSIGLEFSFSKLAKVGAVAFIASTFEILLMLGIGYSLGKLMGWKQMDSLFLGAILSISSTTIIAKILMENKKLNEKFAHIILGILVVEDLWAIVMIAILSGIATSGAFTVGEISVSMIKVFIFVTSILFVGFLLVPRILRYIERFQIAEMMIIVVLGLCLGASLLAAKAGFSIALGAFLMGAVIAETKQAHEIVVKMEPIRDMFTAIFFVSVGMLIEPLVIKEFAVPIFIITVVTIVGKVFSCSLVTFLTGFDSKTSLKVGLGLAQIGEFSFIIAQLGLDTRVTSSYLYPIAVSVSAITTISTPFLMKNADAIIDQIKRFAPQPIVTFASFYPSWISSLKHPDAAPKKSMAVFQEIRPHLLKLFFYAMCIVAVYFGANWYKGALAIGENIYWSIVTVLIFPFFVGFAYCLDQIFWNHILLRSKERIGRTKETGELLHQALRFVITLVCGLVLLLAVSRVVPAIPLAISVLTLVIASGTFFWRAVIRIHEHIEQTIFSVLDYEKPISKEQAKVAHDQLVDLIRTDYPFSFETQDFLLPYEPSAVNRKIKELDLRSKTGASIVGIYRGEEAMPNPSADTELLPGDVLLLIGNDEQIKAAMQFLQRKIKGLD